MGFDQCADRAGTALGSSKSYAPTLDLREGGVEGAVMSNNSITNPQFYNWNKAWFPYCGETGRGVALDCGHL